MVTSALSRRIIAKFPRSGRSSFWRAGWVLAVGLWTVESQAADSGRLEFNRDVRPILSENCFLCHGPDKNTRKAKLRLDQREAAIRSKALVPGKPEESELIKRLLTSNPDDVMPPPESHKKVTDSQRETLRRWIAEGAEYQAHWSYLAPKRPALPQVVKTAWVQQPVDAFVLENLERHHLAPSPEADKRTLLRRLSLDLTGLPPTVEEMDRFLKDRRPGAYEAQVDRLLQSQHYGERMAVPWLDLVRYADTVGYHGDQNINVFPYRDYVIQSFNRNKPFDRFTTEQLAGDLLPGAGVEQQIATGFNRLNMVTREGGAQPGEYLAKYAADRVRTVSTTWLGSTMGCAECHDHKFDPFTTRDFYSLAAFFSDVKQWGVYQDYGYTPNPDLKGWSNDHPFPPELEVENEYLQKRALRLRTEMNQLLKEAQSRWLSDKSQRQQLEAWATEARRWIQHAPGGWIQPEVSLVSSVSNAVIHSNQELHVAGARQDQELVLRIDPAAGTYGALRVELVPEGTNGIARGGGRLSLSASVTVVRGTNKEEAVSILAAEASHHDPKYANGYELLGIKDGWRTSKEHDHERQQGAWLFASPQRLGTGDSLRVRLRSDALTRVRISLSPFPSIDPLTSGATVGWASELAKSPARWSGETGLRLLESALLGLNLDEKTKARYGALHHDWLECRGGKVPTVVTVAWEQRPTRVLARGNWQDETGELVRPSPPQFLGTGFKPSTSRVSRLDLAQWLTSSENPLTARVFVNRLWRQLFGVGLSSSVDDLGAQGEWPTHPELLDWLAVEFRESGWDVKRLVRILVLSSTYRQSSNLRADVRELDPNNRWLSSQNPRRLEAEFVRDNALSIAGLLNGDLGGPSVKPYQPSGYYAALQFPDRDYLPNADERQYRRGLYSHWQRTFLHPMLANFDAPSREECTAVRTLSNTPQQALTLLNDPSFVEAAKAMAVRLTSSRSSTARRLERAYLEALGRLPRSAESASLTRFLTEQERYYAANPKDAEALLRVGNRIIPATAQADTLAAWTSVCRVILNLHETLTRY